jgi:hypothetical protein
VLGLLRFFGILDFGEIDSPAETLPALWSNLKQPVDEEEDEMKTEGRKEVHRGVFTPGAGYMSPVPSRLSPLTRVWTPSAYALEDGARLIMPNYYGRCAQLLRRKQASGSTTASSSAQPQQQLLRWFEDEAKVAQYADEYARGERKTVYGLGHAAAASLRQDPLAHLRPVAYYAPLLERLVDENFGVSSATSAAGGAASSSASSTAAVPFVLPSVLLQLIAEYAPADLYGIEPELDDLESPWPSEGWIVRVTRSPAAAPLRSILIGILFCSLGTLGPSTST